MHRKFGFNRYTALALGFVALSACGRNDTRADTTLANDLSLAAQQRAYQPLDSLSTAERAAALAGASGAAAAAAPARRTASTSGTTRRSSSTVRRSSGSSSGSGAGTVTTTTSSGGEVTVKHPQRDAAIGAAAGAIIGATTSKNK